MDSPCTIEELVAQYCAGDEQAFNRLLQQCDLALKKVTNYFARSYNDAHRDDIYQVACIGLEQAARAFDPARGYKFLTYANLRMRGAAQDFLRDEGVIKVPRLEAKKAKEAGHYQLQSLQTVVRSGNSDGSRDVVLYQRVHDYKIPDPAISAEFNEEDVALDWAISRLPARGGTIVRMRLAGATMKAIGAAVGLSESRISQSMLGLLSAVQGACRARIGGFKFDTVPLSEAEYNYLLETRRLYDLETLADDLQRSVPFIRRNVEYMHGTVALSKQEKQILWQRKHQRRIKELTDQSIRNKEAKQSANIVSGSYY